MDSEHAAATKTVLTTLSPLYVPTWSRREALREIIQNAIDAGGHSIAWESGTATVSDSGPGIELRHLAMGLSEKAPDAIGQFGEGLKLALLVYAREGAACRVYSNGHIIAPWIVPHPDLQTDVLAFDIAPNSVHRQGVTVTAACTTDELAWAKSRFLVISPPERTFPTGHTTVALPGGRVYVNGQLVDEGEYRFTWLLADRQSVNRDRTMFSTSSFRDAVLGACRECDSVELAKLILGMATEEGATWKELAVIWYPGWVTGNFDHPQVWKRAVTSVCGRKACLSSPGSREADGQAEWEGYQVVKPHSNWAGLLAAFLDNSLTVVKGRGAHNVIPAFSLPQQRVAVLTEATRRVEKVVLAMDKTLRGIVQVVDGLEKNGLRVAGMCEGGIIYIDANSLEFEHEAVRVLFHEACHLVSGGAQDLSRAFIQTMESMATIALMRGR